MNMENFATKPILVVPYKLPIQKEQISREREEIREPEAKENEKCMKAAEEFLKNADPETVEYLQQLPC